MEEDARYEKELANFIHFEQEMIAIDGSGYIKEVGVIKALLIIAQRNFTRLMVNAL